MTRKLMLLSLIHITSHNFNIKQNMLTHKNIKPFPQGTKIVNLINFPLWLPWTLIHTFFTSTEKQNPSPVMKIKILFRKPMDSLIQQTFFERLLRTTYHVCTEDHQRKNGQKSLLLWHFAVSIFSKPANRQTNK